MGVDCQGRRATVMGLGHFGGGAAAARWLVRQGAHVTITDLATADSLAESLATLRDAPLAALHLGGHSAEDFRTAELVVVNPAVRPDDPWLRIARQAGASLITEIELFTESCPGTIIGVTGANGKSTTAAMIAAILQAAGRRVFLGGNIGGSLLEQLSEMDANAWVVLELSSFQLWHHRPGARMPHIAVVTGCTPNHLDWHGDFHHYAAAKQRILAGQTSRDFTVLNTHDVEVRSWAAVVRSQLCALPSLRSLPTLAVPGEHNRIDAACAAAAAAAAGCDWATVCRGLAEYRALPQRLELVAELAGRQFYNDSTATTPESTNAALDALPMPIWLMAGGKNKGFDFSALAAKIVQRARGAAFFGACRHVLQACVLRESPLFSCIAVETMQEALAWCRQRAQAGEAVLLSPGCASTDQFRNFRQRGAQFEALLTKNSRVI